MPDTLRDMLEAHVVEASAPCRVDMGGTLDIATFYYPMRHLGPCTFNIALNLRTTVRLLPYDPGRVKISATGFDPVDFPADGLPFDHPLGLMCVIAAYFQADGVHIQVESASPPRSALGGSSVAAVALMGVFTRVLERMGAYRSLYRREIAFLAHALEESVAGVPCGLQDQLAAAYGGVNVWRWFGRIKEGGFEKEEVIRSGDHARFSRHFLVAYAGHPHESRDINGRWVRQFLSGTNRKQWAEIVRLTQSFVDALVRQDFPAAAACMNRETDIRLDMTPDVLDDLGRDLVAAARSRGCGARFTGAGGGGCLWALGEKNDIDGLRETWRDLLSRRDGAGLLEAGIDADGLKLPFL